MADWEENSSQLLRNLTQVLSGIKDASRRRDIPAVKDARGWQCGTMHGLDAPDPQYAGKFRGESGPTKEYEIGIGGYRGTPASEVERELKAFEHKLRETVAALDELIPIGKELDTDSTMAVINLCAWAHAEWVRIHPFANGNGRTARLWANSLAMRYGLPPFVRLRPRPDGGYGSAGEKAMRGDWQPTVRVFLQMLRDFTEGDMV